jgi:hypothetical protein
VVGGYQYREADPDGQGHVRLTWVYRECGCCLRPACANHSAVVGGQIVCDRCRPAEEARRLQIPVIDPID